MGKRLDRKRRKTVSALSLAARKAGKVLTLTRRDALARQLDTAIRMWFLGQDPFAMHLLVMPAYQVLWDLGKKSGKTPDIAKMVGENFTTVYDWARHGSSDPNDIVDFPPRTNELLLWTCTIAAERIFGAVTPLIRTYQAAFVLWLVPENPKFREGADAFMPNGTSAEEASALSKVEFVTKLSKLFADQMKTVS
jgi:hypothetical protein